MKLKYCGSARDYSGYGEANRHDIAALVAAGVDVTAQVPRFTFELSDFGKLGNLIDSLEDRPLGYRIKLIHLTPNLFDKYIEQGIYHIGRVIWETNKLPLAFATGAQLMDEIWTASEHTKQAIIEAGVTKPIYVIPEAIDADNIPDVKPFIAQDEDRYRFYSIFEWNDRKNPEALLTAYWKTFKPEDNVSFFIKTYYESFGMARQSELYSRIKKVKKMLNLDYYAPIYVYDQLLTRNQIYRFHKTFNCFVSAHRGEGWGLPQTEALLMGKPIISTNCGGIHEYLKDGETALLVPYSLTPITEGVKNSQWYTRDLKWAEIDIDQLGQKMRFAYENQTKAAKIGVKGKEFVTNTFNLKTVGEMMKARLTEVYKLFENPA